MGKQVRTRIGNVFMVILDGNRKKYFQYIANDLTQLNSDVIRVFKTSYQLNEEPSLKDIVNDEIDFYAHAVVKFGSFYYPL